MNGLPKISQEYFPFGGGLDQLTPAIAIGKGDCIDSQNFEPEITGGYRRREGYERYDGHSIPSSATYSIIYANITGVLAVGNTITGLSSAATGKILYITGTTVVLGRVTGTFVSGESLQVAAVTKAIATSAAFLGGAAMPSDDADYTNLAANDLRLDILVVPGSGSIRGVWVYKDTVYAFRDNIGGTAGAMYKATAGGWALVAFGTEIQFSSATGGATPIVAGGTIGNLGAAPTKTATVIAVLTRTGTWGTDAVGTLIITPVTGSFSNADTIFVGATQKAVATTATTAIARLPGGQMEFVNANFTSSTNTQKVYGCDGVNLAFEFDGSNYIPIRTGMAADTPAHIMAHRNYLFLSFRGSVQFSGITNPYAWTAILGAGEIACGDDVTGFVPQGGSSAGSSMAIFTKSKTQVLYGSSSLNWNLVVSIYDLGYSAFTCQPVSNNTYGLTARGIQCLITTLTYGDFDYSSISHKVTPFIVAHRGLEIASTSLRTKDQYRLYYSDGYCLCVGLTGDQTNGIMPLNYGKPVRCITTATLSTGEEVTYFGSDDGYIYRDNIGTSHDGAAIEAWVRLPFNHSKSPQIRKRYRRAVLEAKAAGYAKVNMGYDLGYSTPNINPAAILPDQTLTGGGGYWDQFTWDQFTWDSALIEQPKVSLEGTEKNIGFLFYTNRAQDKPITLQGMTIFFTPQRAER
jgi:hypothetical protein